MKNVQHTPTPWHISEKRPTTVEVDIDGWGYTLADCDASHSSLADKVGIEQVEANAAFIVKAVNSYKQLISTIQTIEAMASHGDYGGIETLAAEAIAKTEGK